MPSCSAPIQSTLRHALLHTNQNLETKLILPDGRSLSFRVYGNGFPVVFILGQFNSRLFEPAWSQSIRIAEKCGARIFQIERPGYGKSEGPPSSSYMCFGRDVEYLIGALNISKLSLLGYSSGGAFALACCAALPKHVVFRTCLVSADGPYAAEELKAARNFVYGNQYEGKLPLTREEAMCRAERLFGVLQNQYQSLNDLAKKKSCEDDLEAATIQGLDAVAQDSILETGIWDFDLKTLSNVLVVHGSSDNLVPSSSAEYFAKHLGQPVELVIVQGENHAMIKREFGNLLDKIVPPLANTNRAKM